MWPQVAGRSGGSADAGSTARPASCCAAQKTPPSWPPLGSLLDDPARSAEMGLAGRRRAEGSFAYDVLAHRLADAFEGLAVRGRPKLSEEVVP